MATSGGETLYVYQSESDVPSDGPDGVVVEEVVRGVSEDHANDVYRRLNDLSVDHDFDVPVYDIICHHVWRDGGGLHDASPYSMELLLPLYRTLANHITDATDRVVCYGVGGRYRDLIRDLADAESLSVTFHAAEVDDTSDTSTLFDAVRKGLVNLLDILFSVLFGGFFENPRNDVVVDYPAGRPGTFRPIERQLDVETDTLFSTLTFSYLRRFRGFSEGSGPELPINTFETVRGFLTQIRFAVAFLLDLSVRGETETAVVNAVEAETGLRLEHTVGRLFRRAGAFNVHALLRYGTARRVVRRGGYDAVLLTSTGPTGKALGLAAHRAGVPVLLLPHSMTLQYDGLEAQFPHVMFCDGTIAREVMASDARVETVESGFPKHVEIANMWESLSRTVDRGSVLIGTQPFDDERRRRFAVDVVTAALDRTDRNVVLKVHPGEDPSFYRDLLETLELSAAERDRVTVTDADLYQHIVDSDLMVVINSNVGIESVILGTPTVSYNPWIPDIRSPLYSRHGSVPQVTTPSDLASVLEDCDVESMLAEQRAMLDGLYAVEGNSLGAIVEHIERELGAAVARRRATASRYGAAGRR